MSTVSATSAIESVFLSFFFCLLLYNYTIRVLGLRFVLQLTIWKLKLAGEIGPFSASEQAQALGRR